MAVAFVREISTRSGSQDQDTNHRYTRTFEVYTDDPNDGALTAMTADPLPLFGEFYKEYAADGVTLINSDEESKLVDCQAEQPDAENNFQLWHVRCEYVGLTDPTAVPAEVEFDPVPYQKTLIQDLTVKAGDDPAKPTGKPIQNSAGDPYEHGATVDRSRWRLTIVQNILDESWNPLEVEKYNDTTNKYPFLATKYSPGFPENTCKLQIGAQRVRRSDNRTFYWRRKAVIDINAREVYKSGTNAEIVVGWQILLRDAGYKELKGAGPDKVTITDNRGLTSSSPQPLDGAGHKLTDPTATPFTNYFVGYLSKDWSPLGLENW